MLLSDRYAELRDIPRVRDQSLFLPLRIPNELELQARWFAGEFGKSFVSTAGEKVEIVQFGTWNRESGPDFREVVVRIGDAESVRGSIEIDLLDRSWESHGHAANPAFDITPAEYVTAIATENGVARAPYEASIEALEKRDAPAAVGYP